jgi:hypothetical protein
MRAPEVHDFEHEAGGPPMNNRNRSAIAALAVAVLPVAGIAGTIVYGQNDAGLDVSAVQAAVDRGGTVLLRGTFDFGASGRVVLKTDVDISGETDDSGSPTTTIRRGEWTFFTPYPSSFSDLAPGPRVAIHGIKFVESSGTAIHLAYSGGALVHHNVINQVQARLVTPAPACTPKSPCDCTAETPEKPDPRNFICERAALVVGPALLQGTPNNTFVPRLISGDVVVSDNEINLSGPGLATRIRGTGMFVSMYVGAEVRILRNVVTGNTRTGLAILDGIADDKGTGSVVIADNVIASDVKVGFTQGAGPRAPIGIVTGFNNSRDLGADPELPTIPVLIEGNHIELNGVTSMGIINIWNEAVLSGNSIVIHADPLSTTTRLNTSGGIFATTSHQVLRHNRIIGEACNGIRIAATTEGRKRYDNVAIANDISGFEAFVGGFGECVDYWLAADSHDNTIVGNSGSVIDNGTHNKITGLHPVTGGVGAAVSDAAQHAAEVSQDLGY